VATSTYNANNWVCSLQHTTSANNLIVGFTYAYDNEGNKFYEQKLHELGRSEAYTYDSVYRLTDYQVGQLSGSPPPDCPGALGVPMPVTQTSYNLDKLGNWNSKDTDSIIQTRTHSPSNEIGSINTTAVVSDFNGNTTMYGPDGYSYDEENRLIKATFGPHSNLGQYQYDTFGRRVSKIDNIGVQTLYYYDGWRTIEEQSSAGVTQATYVFGNYLDEALTMDRGGHTYYYHQNALWSVYALSNIAGVGIEGYYYDAYGYQTVVLPGDDGILDFDVDDVYVPGARTSVGNPFFFTGQRFDPETGLLYYKNRHDSTFFGRFMQRDPLDYANGANLYQYVRSNPVRWLDPDGDLCCCVDDVSIVNVKKRIVRPRFGHSFDARIKINYKKNGCENV
jgi:RHS repeat-associated protein